jgi:hypothetical protein
MAGRSRKLERGLVFLTINNNDEKNNLYFDIPIIYSILVSRTDNLKIRMEIVQNF